MSGRRNPFDEIERMFDRMSQNFGDMGRQFGESALGGANVDVADQGEAYVVTADLPGYGKENIDVAIERRRLTIRAERDEETESRDEDRYLRRERSSERIDRTVTLPESVDEDGASATYNNGVLTVTLPKRESERSGRSIDVE